MKKTFKLMLATALLSFGSMSVFAQNHLNDVFPVDNFVYKVTKVGVANGKAGEVKILGVREGANPVVSKALVIPGTISSKVFDDTYSFYVTEFDAAALRQFVKLDETPAGTFTGQVNAESVEFPKYIKEIPASALDGYTNMKTVTFEAGSNLTTVNNGAFATTQIETFDFGNCKKLAGLGNSVFVEAAPAVNSYITSVTLPGGTLFKSIGTAFQRLTSLSEIKGLDESSVTAIVANAFSGDAKLKTLTLPNTIQTIADNAFQNSGIETLTVDVTALVTLGDGNEVYGGTNVLKSLTLTGNLGGVIGEKAFKGATKLETLDLSGLNFASKGQIAGSAFEGCNNAKFTSVTLGNILDQPTAGYTIAKNAFKGCTKLVTFTVGNINSANAIEDLAFDGCSELATVNIGDITAAANVIKADAFKNCAKLATVNIGNINGVGIIGALAFGDKLKTVKIGTVKAGDAAIVTNAFKFADVSGATLKIATGTGEYVSSDDASTAVIAAGAFDFSPVVNAGAAVGFVWPVVTIGEIRSQGGAFAAGALKGNNIAKINFAGPIAKNGLDKKIVEATCTVSQLVFDGTIGIGGIATGAFADLAAATVAVTFNGELAEGAVADGAFKAIPDASTIVYTFTPVTDATVNPFSKLAFVDETKDYVTPDADVTDLDASGTLEIGEIDDYCGDGDGVIEDTDRGITLNVTDPDLKDAFEDNVFEGLGTDGVFDIYRVKFYKAPDPIVDYNKFYVYQEGSTDVAWARFKVDTWTALDGTACDKKIARYQNIEGGGKVKLTLYGTYTDDPGVANDDPAIFMVPLKAINGYYEIDDAYNEPVIVKAELVSGSFADKNIALGFTTAIANDSWWGGLHNADFFINPAIITNQQLIDKVVQPNGVDIYGGTPNIVKDLYVINNPSKYKGFRIDKNPISKAKATYIGEGWWCMLLRKTTADAAKIVWMDENPTAIESLLMKGDVVKTAVEGNGAIYNLQGMQISAPQKGQIYIQNGKKYFAK